MISGGALFLSWNLSNAKEVGENLHFPKELFLPASSTNAAPAVSGTCRLPVTAQKASLMNISRKNTGSGWMPNGSQWMVPWCRLRCALKKSADEGLGRNPTDRDRNGSKIHPHVDGQGIPLGVTVVGANVHDSRLIGATLQNSCEMGAWFPGGKERHLCRSFRQTWLTGSGAGFLNVRLE